MRRRWRRLKQAGLPSSLVYSSYKKFAPRFGFAWRPFGGNRTVLRGGYGFFYGTWEFNDYPQQLRGHLSVRHQCHQQSQCRQSELPDAGASPFPAAPNLVQNVVSVYGLQLQAPNPYTQSWNLTVEREIGQRIGVGGGLYRLEGHAPEPPGQYQPTLSPRRRRMPLTFPVPIRNGAPSTTSTFDLNSIYNAASFTFRRRFVEQLLLPGQLCLRQVDRRGFDISTIPASQDPRNMRLERGRSDLDVGHSFTMAFSWQAPRGDTISCCGAGNWRAPESPARAFRALDGEQREPEPGPGQPAQPHRQRDLPDPTPSNIGTMSARFPRSRPAPSRSAPPAAIFWTRPGSLTLNLSLSRNFAVREKNNLQLRLESFNFLNHANFGRPGSPSTRPMPPPSSSAPRPHHAGGAAVLILVSASL